MIPSLSIAIQRFPLAIDDGEDHKVTLSFGGLLIENNYGLWPIEETRLLTIGHNPNYSIAVSYISLPLSEETCLENDSKCAPAYYAPYVLCVYA